MTFNRYLNNKKTVIPYPIYVFLLINVRVVEQADPTKMISFPLTAQGL